MSKKIQAHLDLCRQELKKYTRIFQKSGDGIDAEEQKKLDEMMVKIERCEAMLNPFKAESEIASTDNLVLAPKPEPVKKKPPIDLSFNPSLMPELNMSWTVDVNKWLDDNRFQLRLNSLKNILILLRKEVKGLENEKDKTLELYIKGWAKDNHVFLETEERVSKSNANSALDDFFAELKKLGKFDWKFDGGSLKVDLVGQTADFNYKHKKVEVSATLSKDEVTAKVSGTVDDVTGTIDGKVKFDGSGGIGLSGKKDKLSGKLGLEIDKDGKVSGSATFKIADVIDFNSSKGSISASLKGDESSWSFGLELSTSGGKQAHLSRKAASEIKNVVNEATYSLKEIYKILETESLSRENMDAIKEQIDPHWKKVDKAITLLSKDIQKPSPKNEILISFGVSGSEPSEDNIGGVVATAGLTLTF